MSNSIVAGLPGAPPADPGLQAGPGQVHPPRARADPPAPHPVSIETIKRARGRGGRAREWDRGGDSSSGSRAATPRAGWDVYVGLLARLEHLPRHLGRRSSSQKRLKRNWSSSGHWRVPGQGQDGQHTQPAGRPLRRGLGPSRLRGAPQQQQPHAGGACGSLAYRRHIQLASWPAAGCDQ